MTGWRMLFAALLPAAAMAGQEGAFAWVTSPGVSELQDGGRTVLAYRHGEGRGCCYFHPLYSPRGVLLTDDGPADHKHHRGLFWAWPVVESGGKRADSWMGRGGIVHRSTHVETSRTADGRAELLARNDWVLDGTVIARDEVRLLVSPVDQKGRRLLEISLHIGAVGVPLRIAGAPEQNKGYGGLSVRYAPRAETWLGSSDGPVPKDEDHGRHAWVEFTGAFAQGRAGVRFSADPDNPGFPGPWCLRYYGFTGANFPGIAGVRIEPGKPIVLRYRLELFDL